MQSWRTASRGARRHGLYNHRVRTVSVGGVQFGGDHRLALIAGPCVIESASHVEELAEALREISARVQVPFVFKASFDKANRTSLSSFRGPGLASGVEALASVKQNVGCPILTDIHEPAQAAPVAEVADVLQIPAFLCRQTDLIVSAAATGRAVNLKKGQFLAPLDMRHVIAKATAGGNHRVLVTERGTAFGYRNLVVDMRAFPLLRSLDYPVIYDVTHSLQLPGAGDGVSAGQSEFIEPLAAAGVAAGVDGLFLEVHERPAAARSDAQNALPLARLEPLLRRVVAIHRAAHASVVQAEAT